MDISNQGGRTMCIGDRCSRAARARTGPAGLVRSVEDATTRLTLFWIMPRKPVTVAVIRRITVVHHRVASDSSNSGVVRVIGQMPALTSVAA
ncbi:hypothetical protein NX871_29780 [Burkholderia thailandensis]|nr:hypothetical protein [Burkholderia thailandensis]MCS6474073.1 hypothetical protein [Burkholderia thailandensis]